MKIFFSILLSFYFLNSFSQTDTIKNKLSIGFSPSLFLSPTPDIFYLEFRPTKKISFEISGGTYDMLNFYLSGFPDKSKSSFTIRSGIKFSKKKHTDSYHEILVFYRQTQYVNRHYYDNGENSIYETANTPFEVDPKVVKVEKIGNEIKNVISAEWLWGKKLFLGKKQHFVIDFYGGFGIRVKLREISITDVGASHYGLSYYTGPNPPFKEEIIQPLPSLQCGIKIAFTF